MDRREFITTAAAAARPAATRRPNILLLMTDQQRWDTLDCYGSRAGVTPNLDRLAQQGVVFEHCYANNPVSTPSRASLLTGKSVPGHGVYRLYDNLARDEVLFPERLREAGYRTALFGKLHVSSRITEAAERHPHDGFDVYDWCLEDAIHLDSPYNGYARWLEKKNPAYKAELARHGRRLKPVPRALHFTTWAAARTIEFLKEQRPDRPFFCFTSLFDPHDPYDRYPPEMAARIDPRRLPPLVRPAAPFSRMPRGIRHEHEYSYLGAFDSLPADGIEKMRFGYHAAIALLDEEFGRILRVLDEQGLADNTLVIFASDHGDMIGDHGLLVKGAFFYDACVRVPLLLRWPGKIAPGARRRGMVQLHDLAATVLSAAGLAEDGWRASMPESRDLRQLCAAPDGQGGTAVCCYRNTGIFSTRKYAEPPIHATMIREGDYKLNLYHGAPGAESEGQLFHLEEDPRELRDLWADPGHRAARERLTGRLLEWMVANEVRAGSRGGEAFPSPGQTLNNKLAG